MQSFVLAFFCGVMSAHKFGSGENYYGSPVISAQQSNQKPVIASVQQQACGIPNGDPSFLTSIEAPLSQTKAGSQGKRQLQSRIAGGSEIQNGTGTLCWEVSILFTSGNRAVTCAGVIVGSRTIITSALCLLYFYFIEDHPASLTVPPGEVNLTARPMVVTTGVITTNGLGLPLYPQEITGCAKNFTVAKALFNNYNAETGDNGTGLLILSEPIDFRADGSCACKLCLSQKSPSVGDVCVASGWNDDPDGGRPPTLAPLTYAKHTILQPTSDPSICIQSNGNSTVAIPLDRFYCAGGPPGAECADDQGAPLFCYDPVAQVQYLAGIVEAQSECGSGIASRFTKISLYLQWIFDSAPLGDISILV